MAIPGTHKVWKELADDRWARLWYAWRGRGAPQIARFEGDTKADVLALEVSEAGAKTIAQGYATATERPKADTRTVGGIITAWRASGKFTGKAESTKRSERSQIEAVLNSQVASMPAKALTAIGAQRVIKKWLTGVSEGSGPAAADKRRDIISKALNWGIGEGYCAANPAQGIENFSNADRSDIIWEPGDIAAFEASARAAWAAQRKDGTPQPNTPPLIVLALLLACYSGLRREDLVNLAWRDIGPNAISLRPRKALRRAKTAKKKAPPPIVVPRTPQLNTVLELLDPGAELRTERPWVLVNSRGKKWTPDGLSATFFKVRNAANGETGINFTPDDPDAEPIAKTLHDARGTFVTHMRCLGFSKEEVAEMVGWSTADVDRVAKRYADANRIALAWLERLTRVSG